MIIPFEQRSLLVRSTVTIVLVAVLVLFSRSFNLIGWDLIFYPGYYRFFTVLFFLFFFWNFTFISHKNITLKKYVLFLYLWPIIPCLNTSFCGGELWNETGIAFGMASVSILFFVYYKNKFSESAVMTVLILFGMLTAAIQIFQTILPSIAIFGVFDPTKTGIIADDIASQRNNMYRYDLGAYTAQMVCLFYFWCKFVQKRNLVYLFFSVIFLVSIYLFLTRQVLLVTMLGLALPFFTTRNRKVRSLYLILFLILIIIIIVYWNALFGEMTSDYKEDTYTTDIRFRNIFFTVGYLISHPVSACLGHGHSKIEYEWVEKYGYWMSDIGFVGESFYYGVVWAIVYFAFLILIYKNREKIPDYLKIFFVTTAIDSIFVFPYRSMHEMFIWISVVYITSCYLDKHFSNNDLK